MEEALKDQEINAVTIALPNYLHCPIALKAAKARKHILVGKPMARSIEEANEMIKVADENKVTLMIGQTKRFLKPCLETKRRLKEIGDVISLSYDYLAYPSVCAPMSLNGGGQKRKQVKEALY